MANVSFSGNLGRDSELTFTQSGKAVLNFSVADTLRRKNQQTGEWEDVSTTWWRVAVWDKAAENLAEHLTKGTRVVVDGTVHSREYEKDGVKKLAYDVTARTVGVIPRGQSSGAPRSSSNADAWAPASDVAPF